ncbi:MAG: DUF3488 and transglutaminase-like domain-containing protein, partial [Nocardioides sp.]
MSQDTLTRKLLDLEARQSERPRPPRESRLRWPGTATVSLLAALTTWVTLLSWSPFAERSSSYLVPLAAGCLLVAATGILLRSARQSALLVLLVQILVVGGWLHHRWAESSAWWGYLPTRESLAEVGRTLVDAAEVARVFAAPVPAGAVEFAPLLIVSGMCTALLVDFLACGLRRAPVAGLPLLAAYTAPISILAGGVSWTKFAVGAMCFLFLITAQEATRMGRWGRQVSHERVFDTQSTQVSGQALWSSARKIGLTATGLAVLVPVLVPTLSLSVFEGFGNGPGGNGDAVTLSNPMVDMRRDLSRGADIDLLRVTTDDPDPSYLRVTVLDRFDGESWRPSEREIPREQMASGPLPEPPGLDPDLPRQVYQWRVDIGSDFNSRWLPSPYPAQAIDAPGDWRYDQRTLDFISAVEDQDTRDQSYALDAIRLSVTAEDLATTAAAPASVFQPMTELPEEMPESITRLALDITLNQPSKFEQAVALQRWFRVDGEFDYSLDRSPGNGLGELETFLTEDRSGYCEQFATAMATMGRALDIPSRVAVGFLRPTSTDGGQTYVYSTHDLHAWPEMYFQGTGWVRFEPTPAEQAPSVPGYTRGEVDRGPSAAASSSQAVVPDNNRINQPSADAGTGSDGGGGGFDAGLLVRVLGVAAMVALVALTPRLLRAQARRRRWNAATTPHTLAESAWAELRATALDLGVAWDDRVSVRARARELVRSFASPGVEEDALTRAEARGAQANPEATTGLERLVRLVELARYARSVPPSDAQVDATRADVER